MGPYDRYRWGYITNPYKWPKIKWVSLGVIERPYYIRGYNHPTFITGFPLRFPCSWPQLGVVQGHYDPKVG